MKQYKQYSQYKESGIEWIGQIPAHWEVKKLKDCLSVYTGNSIPDEDKDNYLIDYNALRYISTKNISSDTNLINENELLYIPNTLLSNYRIAPKNSYLLCVEGGSAGKKYTYLESPACFVNKLACFYPNHQGVFEKYFYYGIESNSFQDQFSLAMSGLIGGVSTNSIKNFLVISPPLAEQQQIADYLDQQSAKIDELVQKQNKLIETLQEKKKSLINNVVTKGIRPQAVMLDTNVFDRLLNDKTLYYKLPKDIKYYVTHIQRDQIGAITDKDYKTKIQSLFNEIVDKSVPTKGWVLGISRLGEFMLSSEEDGNKFDKLSNKNFRHIEDSLIILTADHFNIVVITEENYPKNGGPFKRASKNNYKVMQLNEFLDNYSLKDSGIEWLGQIPSHWQVNKLRYLFDFNTGLSVTKAEFIENGINCLNYGDIHTRYSIKLDLAKALLPKVKRAFIEEKPKCLLSVNDLVFCDTSEDLDGVGNCVVISNLSGDQLLSGSHTIVAKPKKLLNSVFIRYALMSKAIKSCIENEVTGIKVFSITQGILNAISITVPPLKEQQQIADYLDQQTAKIDELITKAKSVVELLKEHKQSLINHVVTGKIKVIENVI